MARVTSAAIQTHGLSLREGMQNVAIVAHDLFRQFHLPREIRIVRCQAEAPVGGFGHVNRIARPDTELAQKFLWDGRAGRGADGP